MLSLVDHAVADPGAVRGTFAFFQHDASILNGIIARFAARQLRVVLDAIRPLAHARTALTHLAGGHARGKLTVRMQH